MRPVEITKDQFIVQCSWRDEHVYLRLILVMLLVLLASSSSYLALILCVYPGVLPY